MRILKTVGGAQSLRHIIERSSSARVLDLHTLAWEVGDDPDYRARPMFTHPVLNRTLIAKHHPRHGEYEFGGDRGAIVTKVIFPFDHGDLDLGGQYLLVDDPDLKHQLERHLDYSGADVARDVTVLRLLDRLPTLDPFLMYEGLKVNEVDVAPCYFRLSPTDRTEMLDYVAQQMVTLIQLCLGGALVVTDAQAKRLSQLMLSEGYSPELSPLRLAMRMDAPQFTQAMFCWKAVLYYRWRSRTLGPEVKATRRSIGSLDISRFDNDVKPFVRRAVMELESLMSDCERRIAEMFKLYEGVFEALTEDKTPEPFRRFLIDGPQLFSRLGERMGRLEQLSSYWRHQFPGRSPRQLSPETVFDGLRNLLSALSLDTNLLELEPEERGVVWRSDDVEARVTARRPRGGAGRAVA